MSNRILLDTCALVWAVAEPGRLSKKAQTILTERDIEVWVSAISCAELACGVERQRIKLDRHWKLWFRHFVALNGWQVEPITLQIVEEAYSLPEVFHSDPADRIIVATARINSAILVTADRRILEYPHVDSLW